MVKSELLQELCNIYPNILRRDIKKIIDIIIFEIAQALREGRRVEIRGVGSWYLKRLKARIARNPKTGEKIKVADSFGINFKMSKILLNKLNKNFTENKISDNN